MSSVDVPDPVKPTDRPNKPLFAGWAFKVTKIVQHLHTLHLYYIFLDTEGPLFKWYIVWVRGVHLNYRICANKTPFSIKPPLQPNLNKPPLFCPKSPLFEAFLGKNPKNFNSPPPWNPQSFIRRQRLIGADTVLWKKILTIFKEIFK